VNDDLPEFGGVEAALKAAMRSAGPQAWYGLRLLGRSGRALPRFRVAIAVVLVLFLWGSADSTLGYPPGARAQSLRTAPDLHEFWRNVLSQPWGSSAPHLLSMGLGHLPGVEIVAVYYRHFRLSDVPLPQPWAHLALDLPRGVLSAALDAPVLALLLWLVLAQVRMPVSPPGPRRLIPLISRLLGWSLISYALVTIANALHAIGAWEGGGLAFAWVRLLVQVGLFMAPYVLVSQQVGLERGIADGLRILGRRPVTVLVMMVAGEIAVWFTYGLQTGLTSEVLVTGGFPFWPRVLWAAVLALATCLSATVLVWTAGAYMMLALDERSTPAPEASGV
jgi:hypothetical protein